ncbi:MAG: aldehyde ferredoxin oxidoreductase C-terminal domain-containing protein, partial [Candidatus Bathyarchaeia archaeon]
NKGKVLAIMQNWHEVLESLIICKFLGIPPGHIPGLYALVTGMTISLEELLKAGERIYTLKRMYNVRCGVTRKDDTLPYRIMNEGLKEGGTLGNTVSQEDLKVMLDEYYAARGWDENGIPENETLKNLGLLE